MQLCYLHCDPPSWIDRLDKLQYPGKKEIELRLQNIIANAQAEHIITHFQPHKEFKVLAGYCFAGIKGRIGATFAVKFCQGSCLPPAPSHAPRMDADATTTPTNPRPKQRISASTCLSAPR